MFGNSSKPDIIIVTGCNAVGKTTASNYLRKFANEHNILYEHHIIADSQCLFEELQLDDQKGGLHHTHTWCEIDERGHEHTTNDHEFFPFTVTDNVLPDRMRKRFFKKLTKLQKTGKYWFVEWAGGVNTNIDSSIDYSYAQVKHMLEEGNLSYKWLKRVKAIVHVTAEQEVRFSLNKQRSVPFCAQPEAIQNGTAFWQKDEHILRFYGRDDFNKIMSLIEKTSANIYKIENNGDEDFFAQLETKANHIFLSERSIDVKSIKISFTKVAFSKTEAIVAGIWAGMIKHAVGILPFGTTIKNTKQK